jgi:hypothetical protein
MAEAILCHNGRHFCAHPNHHLPENRSSGRKHDLEQE